MEPNAWMMSYPNVAEGVMRFLNQASVWNLETAEAMPVPGAEGVWLVTGIVQTNGRQGQAIVYLKGYLDSLEQVRQENEFWEVESGA